VSPANQNDGDGGVHTKAPYVAISIIPPNLQAPLACLSKKAMSRAKKDLRKVLTDCPAVTWGIVAYDFTFNDYTGQDGGLVHQPHFHGILSVTDPEEVKAGLKTQYPGTQTAKKPVWLEAYDGTEYGASYIFKTMFTRRSSYIDDGNPNRNPFSNTKPFTLRAPPDVDLKLMLDFMGFDKRLLWIKTPAIRMAFMKKNKSTPKTPL
jgi:hypothetical protein